MNSNMSNAGFVRISDLMLRIMTAAGNQDKIQLVSLAETFAEDCSEFTGVMLKMGGVTDDDLNKYSTSHEQVEEMLKTAATTIQMRKENPPGMRRA